MTRISVACCLLLVSALLAGAGCHPDLPPPVEEAARQLPAQIDFNLHIKPILSDRCFKCHGPDDNARKAELHLNTQDGLFAATTNSRRKRIVVPGSVSQSELVYRLISQDPDYMMPPPESNLTMSPEDIANIVRWIEQGAEYKPHWSQIPPQQPDRPAVQDTTWARNGIDFFVQARLEANGLRPSPEADKEILIRRVTFDLTGLPPTLAEIDAFLADQTPDAYERVIDRLLASETYGERMTTEWLDVARYADSHGYQDDGMRTMWPWRDWVIKAFNENMPFDRFVTWQLAGDLLPDPTQEQLLATGFNRNHLQSQEGGIVPEEYRVEYVADRTHTFGKAFLGLTLECARCHDHKFDPISQKEYYQVFSFFNSINEFGNIPYAGEASPTVILKDAEAEATLASLRAQMRDLEARTNPDHDAYDAPFKAWLQRLETSRIPTRTQPQGLIGYYPLDALGERDSLFHFANRVNRDQPGYYAGDMDYIPAMVPGNVGTALMLRGNGWLDMGEDRYFFDRNEPFSISIWFNIAQEGTEGPLFARSGGLFNGKRGYMCELQADGTLTASLNHVFPANTIEIKTLDRVAAGRWQHLVMTYDGSSRAAGLTLYLNGKTMASKVKADNLKQSIRYTVDPTTGEKTNWDGNGTLRIGWIGFNMPMLDHVSVDEFRVYDRRLTALEVAALNGAADPIGDLLARAPEARTDAEVTTLRAYYVTTSDPEYRRTFRTLTELRGHENALLTALPEVMIMQDLPEPRPTHVLQRGAYDAPAEPVEPGTPVAVMDFPEDLPRNRLGLAKWLVDPRNPLPARVTVNRYWQLFFGKGLVATPDDFGNQGALPTHPLLLDWLATTFVASGWDVKALHRLIVTSATYRQSSVADAALLARDPDNLLLARGPSYRLPAEMIRDNALAVSGLLVPTIGGPPVKPYQPEGLWKELATRNATEYVQDHGDKLYRRSMYTIWKRTTPPPSMISFDAAERNFCTVRRQTTSTPLQALVLLNDPQYVEAARVLAERTIEQGGTSLEGRITFAFRLLTSRHPLEKELALLTALFEAEYDAFREHPQRADALLRVGESPRAPHLHAPEVAALTVVANTIMNFDEAVTKR